MHKISRTRAVSGLLTGLWAFAFATALEIPVARAQDTGVAADSGAAVSAVAPKPRKAAKRASAPASARKATQKAGGQHFIELRSRHALSYGHTFVVFGRLNANGEVGQIKPEMVAGLHPAGDSSVPWTIGHAVPVPAETGWSDGDLEEEYVSARYRILLSPAEYSVLMAYIKEKRANSPIWHAALNNCNQWVADIARFMGLQTAFTWRPPADFINGTKELNGGRTDAPALAAMAGGGQPQPAAQWAADTVR